MDLQESLLRGRMSGRAAALPELGLAATCRELLVGLVFFGTLAVLDVTNFYDRFVPQPVAAVAGGSSQESVVSSQ